MIDGNVPVDEVMAEGLGEYFDTDPEYWMELQEEYEEVHGVQENIYESEDEESEEDSDDDKESEEEEEDLDEGRKKSKKKKSGESGVESDGGDAGCE